MSVGQLVDNFGQEWNVSVCKIAITFSTDIHGPQRLSAFDFGALFVSFPSATTRFRCLAVIEVSEQLLNGWLKRKLNTEEFCSQSCSTPRWIVIVRGFLVSCILWLYPLVLRQFLLRAHLSSQRSVSLLCSLCSPTCWFPSHSCLTSALSALPCSQCLSACTPSSR